MLEVLESIPSTTKTGRRGKKQLAWAVMQCCPQGKSRHSLLWQTEVTIQHYTSDDLSRQQEGRNARSNKRQVQTARFRSHTPSGPLQWWLTDTHIFFSSMTVVTKVLITENYTKKKYHIYTKYRQNTTIILNCHLQFNVKLNFYLKLVFFLKHLPHFHWHFWPCTLL